MSSRKATKSSKSSKSKRKVAISPKEGKKPAGEPSKRRKKDKGADQEAFERFKESLVEEAPMIPEPTKASSGDESPPEQEEEPEIEKEDSGEDESSQRAPPETISSPPQSSLESSSSASSSSSSGLPKPHRKDPMKPRRPKSTPPAAAPISGRILLVL